MKSRIAIFVWRVFCVGVAVAAGARAASAGESVTAPAPRVVIYPGDLIREDMLFDIEVDKAVGSTTATALDRRALIGKMARQTLLPGRTIPASAVAAPRLVRNGAEVELVFAEGGLRIVTNGSALQEGGVDDLIKVRNLESGVTVTGVVQADGSVRVKG